MNEYLDMFLEESQEHIQSMSDEMMKFEQEPKNLEIVAVMFRAAHTLKGMSGTMGFEKMQKLTHTIENMMDDIRNEKTEPNEEIIDFMFQGIERLELLLGEIRNTGVEKTDIGDLLNIEARKEEKTNSKLNVRNLELDDLDKNAVLEAIEEGMNVFNVHFELRDDCLLKAIRINMFFKELLNYGEILKMYPEEDEFEKDSFDGILDLIFITSSNKEEIECLINKLSEVKIISATPSYGMDVEEKRVEKTENKSSNIESEDEIKKDPGDEIENNKVEENKGKKSNENTRKHNVSIRVNLDKIEYLMGLFEEFIVEKGRLQNIAARIKDKELKESFERISRNSTEMQTSLLSMRMIPLDTILNRFPRMVRSTSKELGKNINFIIEGAETELDRTVVEELGDPLVHILRNSLDHGIEVPEKRKEAGKSEQGTILLKAYHRGNEAVIEINDDGNGIDVDKIKNKLLKQNVLSEKELKLQTDEQIIQHIFSSGLSTAEKITNLSGRGVGLDVVKTKIESLGGSVKVETEKGVGSTFIITLPLTLSIIQSLLVTENEQTFAVPLSNVIETIAVNKEQIKELMGKQVLYYRNEIYSTHRFTELFGANTLAKNMFALIIQNSFQKYALLVNEIIGQQEIVLKPLQGYTKNVSGVTGATVLGDGSVAFVFDVNYFQK